MKQACMCLIMFCISLFSITQTNADYSTEYITDPIFMEDVYGFIHTPDVSTGFELDYCEQVYIEVYRRRDFTQDELQNCGDFIQEKIQQEMSYMRYMMNNRELFY